MYHLLGGCQDFFHDMYQYWYYSGSTNNTSPVKYLPALDILFLGKKQVMTKMNNESIV